MSALLMFSRQILWGMGALLVENDVPRKADVEIVLGGDATGGRIMKACELIRSGYVPRAIVSGGGPNYGFHESALAIDYAARQGCPADYFIPVLFQANSTFNEAQHVITELRRAGAHRVLIVTSPSHTARAARIFRRLAPDLDFYAVPCQDRKWDDGHWWRSREGRKVWLLESVKSVTDLLGL